MRRGVFSVSIAPWGLLGQEFLDMCDYSLLSVRTRSAKVGEKLITYNFGTGTRGFAARGLIGGCLPTSWYRTRVRDANQVSNRPHVSYQYQPHR
jgi:hypothetical protein